MSFDNPILCIKLFCLDYYYSKPLPDIDKSYSELRGSYASKLPIIRMYGTTPSGQKVCANIHGYLPHLFVALPRRNDYNSFSNDFIRAFCTGLEKAVRSRTRDFEADDMLVFGASIVEARSIYGFREHKGAFLKVHLLDPSLLFPCAEVLAGGQVMDRPFEAIEVHIPFLLKFCVDYNLYGMNYMRAKYFRVRGGRSVCLDTTVSSLLDGTYQSQPAIHTGDQLLPADVAPRYTSTEVEVDISVHDILNRAELADCSEMNPGLEALWSEERARRISAQFGSGLPEVPAPDDLLPLTKDGTFPISERERALRDRWTQLVGRLGKESSELESSVPASSDDFVARWLEQSQDENEEPEDTQVSSALAPYRLEVSELSRVNEIHPFRTDDSMCGASMDELKRLAHVTEDADASLVVADKELPWGFLKSSSEWSEVTRISQLSQHSVRSSQETRESVPRLRITSISDESQDLLSSAPSVDDQDTVKLATSPRSELSFPGTQDGESTLLSCATRSAIKYVLSHGYDAELPNIEQGEGYRDDEEMLERVVVCHAAGTSPPGDGSVDANESTDLWEPWNESADTTNELGANTTCRTDLERIEESDEELSSIEDAFEDPMIGPLSPWSIQSDDHPIYAQTQIFPLSQSLFDSVVSEEKQSDEKATNDWPHIPQLDGTEDQNEPATTQPERGRRRRLGLRLTTNRANLRMAKVARLEPTMLNAATPQDVITAPTAVPVLETNASSSIRTPPYTPVLASDGDSHTDDVERVTVESETKINTSPVVLLERLNLSELHTELPQTPERPVDPYSNRLSPRDDFEDLLFLPSPISQVETTPVPSGIQSFHPLEDAASSQTTLDEPLSLDLTPGHLTLFSQTQYSPAPVTSSNSMPAKEVDPLPIPVPVYPVPPSLWRPSIPPPSLSSVNQWLQSCSTSTHPTPTSAQHAVDNTTNSMDTSTDSEITLGTISSLPLSHSGEQATNSHATSQNNQTLLGDQPTSSSQPSEPSLTPRRSSVASMSMLYQAASQRCYLPVQTDHTTVASLELYCRCRLVASRGRKPMSDGLSSQKSLRSSTMRRGLLPNAKLDPIILACFSVRTPVTHGAKTSRSRPHLFVLVNTTELPKLETTASKWPGPFRLALTTYLNGVASKDATNSTKASPSKRLTPSTAQTRFIWCTSEWSLLSWIIYLVQWYDPDILLGYDVERYSWGYLVQRAAHLNRHHYPRELSRLSPDILKCPCCEQFIAVLKQFATCSSEYHLNEATLSDVDPSSCCCPCRPPEVGQKSPPKASPLYRFPGWPPASVSGRTGGQFPCPGRVVLCLWRIVMSELSLFEYSMETVVFHLLKQTVPKFGLAQLNQWFTEVPGVNRWRTVDYWCYRSLANHRIIEALDLIGRTSEFARVFGIEFFHVLSRGSQYRVESLLCRTAHAANFLLDSPNVAQRARQRAPETIPLNLEPDSRLYVDGPVAVLDFQSLYPSIMIAYNYCYSTCLGRLSSLEKETRELFEFGCLTHSVPADLIQSLGSAVNISPNGVVFVNSSIREGILPRMVKQLLSTRLMVKDSMKLYKEHRSLGRLLDARQLGLKLMANVIFGYTAASFSGRMPCVEVGDSIVSKARETLEQAIQLVESGSIALPHRTKPRVVYGDTDSLFVHLPGCDKSEAFEVAHAIANAITSQNPAPIKLKMEKIYYPCLLEAKKRYVGYAYESLAQTEPVFDAKGVETVRRDSCPFVGKVVESTLRVLFDQFPLPISSTSGSNSTDVYANVPHQLRVAESRFREAVRQFSQNLLNGRIPFADFILTRPYWGQSAYRPGNFAPALQIARRLIALDSAAEPAVGERVAYYVAPGRPDQTILSCLRCLAELDPPATPSGMNFSARRALPPRLNLCYYLDKQLLPPLNRITQLLDWNIHQWLLDLPRYQVSSNQRYWITSGRGNSQQSQSLAHLDSFDSQSSSFSQTSNLNSGRAPRRRRQSAIMRAFVGQPVRVCPNCGTQLRSSMASDAFGNCKPCVDRDPELSRLGAIRLGSELQRTGQLMTDAEQICTGCLGNRGGLCDPTWLCISIHCPAHSKRLLAASSLASFWSKNTHQLARLNTSW